MVRRANRFIASPADNPIEVIPIARPPIKLTVVMMRPAIASPFTNFDAPSIAPKKSASCAISLRRRRASPSLMRPALRSASIAICLPGIASSVKRAATSETRDDPLVMTTNWMMTRMKKMTRPTTSDPPTTDCPNDVITEPAEPVPKICRVVETLSPKRNSVARRRIDGNDARSSTRARSLMREESALLRRCSPTATGQGQVMAAERPSSRRRL